MWCRQPPCAHSTWMRVNGQPVSRWCMSRSKLHPYTWQLRRWQFQSRGRTTPARCQSGAAFHCIISHPQRLSDPADPCASVHDSSMSSCRALCQQDSRDPDSAVCCPNCWWQRIGQRSVRVAGQVINSSVTKLTGQSSTWTKSHFCVLASKIL